MIYDYSIATCFFWKKIFKKMPYELASVFPLVLFEKKY